MLLELADLTKYFGGLCVLLGCLLTATTPAGGQQWVKGKKFPYDAKLISAGNWKGTLRLVGKLRTLQEIRGS